MYIPALDFLIRKIKKKWKIKIISIIILYPILWIRIMYKYHYLIELETKTENNGVFLSSSSKSLEFFIRTEVWCVRLSFLDVLHEALLLALGLCGLMNYFVSKSCVICKVWTLHYWHYLLAKCNLYFDLLPMVTMLKLLTVIWVDIYSQIR